MSGSTVLNTFAYNFDSASQLTSTSATGTQMTYTFDNLGRVLTASNSGTTNIPTTVQTNVYDANSRRTQQTATVASVADYKNTWTWDNANRQTQVKQEGQTGGSPSPKNSLISHTTPEECLLASSGTTIWQARRLSPTRPTRMTYWLG